MEYAVEAKTRKQLRELAHILRRHLEVEDVLYFPIVEGKPTHHINYCWAKDFNKKTLYDHYSRHGS